jgi:putative restriction endonuclease
VALVLWTREHGGEALIAPLDVGFTDDTVLQPDVLLLRAEHLHRVGERPYPPAGPRRRGVVAVDRAHDRVRKRAVYERHAVPQFWFVDLDSEQVEVYRLAEGRYPDPLVRVRGDTLTSPLVPGFALALGGLFERS